jgi:phosphomannomutase
LRKNYPHYVIAKKKLTLNPALDFNSVTETVKSRFQGYLIDERDGLWIGHADGWVQIRKSNTEPIMRIYAEGRNEIDAGEMADRIIGIVNKI